MSDKETAIEMMMGFSIEKMYNTVMLFEEIVAKHGMMHGDRIADQYCKSYGIPVLNFIEFMKALASAMQRKMMLIDPSQDVTDKTIIH